jgi:hypothetical protein
MRRIMTLAAAAGLVLAPALALAQTTPTPPNSAPPIPDQEISKAGSALHDVAKLQQKYQPQMDAASPTQKQGLSEQANAEAVQAIQSHGLSVQEYSNVMRTAQTNPQVKQRLLQAARQAD